VNTLITFLSLFSTAPDVPNNFFFCDVNAILEYIYNFFFFFYIYIHKGLSSGSFQIQLRESILSFNDFIVSTFARAFFSLFNYIRREEIDKKTLYKLYI